MTEAAAISAIVVLIVFIVRAVWPRKEPEEHQLTRECRNDRLRRRS